MDVWTILPGLKDDNMTHNGEVRGKRLFGLCNSLCHKELNKRFLGGGFQPIDLLKGIATTDRGR